MRPRIERFWKPILSQRLEELLVRLELLELLEQRLHRVEGLVVGHLAPEPPDLLELRFGEQQLLPPRARADEVERREDAPIGELPRQVELHVAGALELLEDDVV